MSMVKRYLNVTTKRKAQKRAATAKASDWQRIFTDCVRAYGALTGTQKSAWLRIAAQMPAVSNLATPSGLLAQRSLSAQGALIQINTALLGCNQPMNPIAPAQITPPATLPALTLAASVSAGAFSLTVTSPVAYGDMCQFWASKPLLMGQKPTASEKFSPIYVMHSLPPETLDLSAAYTEAFGAAEVGQQVRVQVVSVSASGFRAAPVTLSAVVTDAG